MNESDCRKFGSLWAIGQGVLTALAPRLTTRFTKKMLARSFENAEELEPKPAYLRQLRALGIGLAAAGIAGYVMEAVSRDDESTDRIDGEASDGGTSDGGTA